MFKTALEQLEKRVAPSEYITWSDGIPGVRICDFFCALPSSSGVSCPGQIELLFCRGGGLSIEWRDGRSLRLHGRETLLLSGLSEGVAVRQTSEHIQGVLVAVEISAAQKTLSQLGALMGGLDLDLTQVSAASEEQGGCIVLPQTPWSEAALSPSDRLSPAQNRTYYGLLSIELLYLVCCNRRLFPWRGPSPDPVGPATTAQRVGDYILAHLEEPLTIRQLSQHFHISPTLLKSSFRLLYGRPVRKYIQEHRIRQAAQLLLTSAQPVFDIALSVGYGSVSQFTSLFRRYYQMTPSQYRRSAAEKMSDSVVFRPNQSIHSDPNTI